MKMRKKLLAIACTFVLATGVVQPSTTYAAGDVKTTQAIAAAEEKTFGKEYSVTWSDEVGECWSKITLNKKGILKVNMTKPENKTLGEVNLNLKIYDKNEKCIYFFRDDRSLIDATVNVGLNEGTYYIKFAPQYSGYVKGKTTNYTFAFSQNKYCEAESNNTRETATEMKLDHVYTGYMGSNADSLSNDKDEDDVYAVTLKKGQIYKFIFNADKKGTTIAEMFGTNVSFESFITSYDKDKFCVSQDSVFVAPYTGVYYVHVGNYSGDQYKYKVAVNNVTPKKPTLNSIKTKGKTATVSWKKSRGDGYQIQYSVNKNFKNAKMINVTSAKDTAKVKKLSSNKKYYVRVRSYVKYSSEKSNKNYKYSSWSSVKNVKVK